jgi:hypothetical protein
MTTAHLVQRSFDLNGALVRIETSDAGLIAPLLPYLGELGSAPQAEAAAFHVTIARGRPQEVPSAARLLNDGRLPEGTPHRLSVDGDTRWLIVPDRLSLRFSTAGRMAHMQVAPGAETLIGGSAGIVLIETALASSQQTLVHAAALRLPQREAAVCVLAPSGTGKTTTSLALALQGFALMADDATVLTPPGGASGAERRVWGLPRPLKVHRRTAELLPQVGRLLGNAWNAEGEQGVSGTALRSVIEVLPPRPVPLAAFIALSARVVGEHRVRPMSKSDLLVRFAGDNVSRSPYGVLDDDLVRYRNIAGAVAETPALELNVGSRLESLSASVLASLG